MFAFLMNGYTACGKSTTASMIESALKEELVSSAIIQSNAIRNAREDRNSIRMGYDYMMDGSHRDIIYEAMLREFSSAVNNGSVPILDATYNKRKWRQAAYEESKKLGVNLYVVNCICPDEIEIKRRICIRILSGSDPHFLELRDPDKLDPAELIKYIEESWEIYRGIRSSSEDVHLDEHGGILPRIITVDTLNNSTSANFAEATGLSIHEIIRNLFHC